LSLEFEEKIGWNWVGKVKKGGFFFVGGRVKAEECRKLDAIVDIVSIASAHSMSTFILPHFLIFFFCFPDLWFEFVAIFDSRPTAARNPNCELYLHSSPSRNLPKKGGGKRVPQGGALWKGLESAQSATVAEFLRCQANGIELSACRRLKWDAYEGTDRNIVFPI